MTLAILAGFTHNRRVMSQGLHGTGNSNGLYHGTQLLNHGQIDRWNIVATLNYLSSQEEMPIVQSRVPEFNDDKLTRLLKFDSCPRYDDARGLRGRRPLHPDVTPHG